MSERVYLLNEVPQICENDWIFQEGNSQIHNERRTKDPLMAILRDSCGPSIMFARPEPYWKCLDVW